MCHVEHTGSNQRLIIINYVNCVDILNMKLAQLCQMIWRLNLYHAN